MLEKTAWGTILVGAGQAALSCAARLRAGGYDKPVLMIGAENLPPYQRPPLSKSYLLNKITRDDLLLRPLSFYNDKDISLRLGQAVTAIDPEKKAVTVGGDRLSYDNLVLATGTTPRRLPSEVGGDLKNCFTIRTVANIDRLAPDLREGARLLVIGGGYIGLEIAAVARSCGLEVTVIEASDRILRRVAAPQTADYFRTLHRDKGVRILEQISLTRLAGNDKATEAILGNGERLHVDLVAVGIGVTATDTLARQAGLACDNGITTDAKGQSSAPAIWAIGDCASFPHEQGQMRLESVGHAIDHGALVADNILGQDRSYTPRPWFWSDQYDVKLQIAGLNSGYDSTIIRRNDTGANRAGDNKVIAQSVWYYRKAQLCAVDAMNDPRAYMVGKRLIESGRSPAKDSILSAENLKELLKP